jgi:hypothetical protein
MKTVGDEYLSGIRARLSHLESTYSPSDADLEKDKANAIADIKYLLNRLSACETVAKKHGELLLKVRQSISVLVFDLVGQSVRDLIRDEVNLLKSEGEL